MEQNFSILGGSTLSSTIAFVILIFITALMALLEIAFIAVRQSALLQLSRKGNWRAKLALPLASDPSVILATAQIGITLASVIGGATVVTTASLATAKLLYSFGLGEHLSLSLGVAIATVLFAFCVMLFGELVPKRIAYQYAEPIALALAPLLKAIVTLAWPFVKLLTASTWLVCAMFGVKLKSQAKYSAAELAIILEMTEDFTREEKHIAHRVLTFAKTQVRESMVPRTDFIAISGDKTVADFIDLSLQTGRSRLPVFGEDLDDIIGILHLRDVGVLSVQGKRGTILREITEPPLTVPENAGAQEALMQMREAQRQMAIVVDEFGQVVGLVTAEDLLEELVGELYDESDVRTAKVKRLPDGTFIVDAAISLRDLSFALGTDFPLPEDYETLGGLILDLHGSIPEAGATVSVDGWDIEVMRVQGRRVRQVKMSRARKQDA